MVYHRILNIVPCAIQLFFHPICNCLHLIFQFLEELLNKHFMLTKFFHIFYLSFMTTLLVL